MAAISLNKAQKAETDIAVLQVEVENVKEKIGELKDDIKDVRDALEKHSEEHTQLFKDMQESSANAHKAMSEKISSLEKWRWMMMGAGIVIGSLGYDTVAKLLK
jgi:FtsZ-binding cell division protein ZapB